MLLSQTKKLQSGLTLIEVLITLVILSTVIGVVYSVLVSSINITKKNQDEILLHQEANKITLQLTELHQEFEYLRPTDTDPFKFYKFIYDSSNDTYKLQSEVDSTEVYRLSDERYDYEFFIDSTELNASNNSIQATKNVYVEITITDKGNNQIKIETALNRL